MHKAKQLEFLYTHSNSSLCLYSQTISRAAWRLPGEQSEREISCPQMQSGGANPSSAKFNLIAARLSIRSRLMRRTPSPTDFQRVEIFFTPRTRRRLLSFIQFAPRAAFSAAAFFPCAACSRSAEGCQRVPTGATGWRQTAAPQRAKVSLGCAS